MEIAMALLKVMVGGQIAALGRPRDSLEFDASKCTLTSQNMALKLSFSLFALFILSSLAAHSPKNQNAEKRDITP